MTLRGRALLGLGLLTYVAARAFGSKPLYPVALGLLFATVAAWLWVRLAQGPMRLHRELGRPLSEGGIYAHGGRRLLLRRPSGFDLHSVREYEQGESLRKVHWRSTAKRGELMVKELEDAPRDEVAVLLDAEASAVVGESFDVQVRAAGSLLLAQARRGRRAVLLVNGAHRTVQRVHSYQTDRPQAYDLLAAAA